MVNIIYEAKHLYDAGQIFDDGVLIHVVKYKDDFIDNDPEDIIVEITVKIYDNPLFEFKLSDWKLKQTKSKIHDFSVALDQDKQSEIYFPNDGDIHNNISILLNPDDNKIIFEMLPGSVIYNYNLFKDKLQFIIKKLEEITIDL